MSPAVAELWLNHVIAVAMREWRGEGTNSVRYLPTDVPSLLKIPTYRKWCQNQARIAQLVERRRSNPKVVGSNPPPSEVFGLSSVTHKPAVKHSYDLSKGELPVIWTHNGWFTRYFSQGVSCSLLSPDMITSLQLQCESDEERVRTQFATCLQAFLRYWKYRPTENGVKTRLW